MSGRFVKPRGNIIRRALSLATWVLPAQLLSACYATQPASPPGSALDPSATGAAERDVVNVLGPDFDPFSAYPELTPDAAGGHQHHPGMQMGASSEPASASGTSAPSAPPSDSSAAPSLHAPPPRSDRSPLGPS